MEDEAEQVLADPADLQQVVEHHVRDVEVDQSSTASVWDFLVASVDIRRGAGRPEPEWSET